MLNRKEMADRLGIHGETVDSWAKHGIIKAHVYNDHGWQLYEVPGPDLPTKHCSRWHRLVDRATIIQKAAAGSQNTVTEPKEV
jgi:predicted site-specific integrase-resolvase